MNERDHVIWHVRRHPDTSPDAYRHILDLAAEFTPPAAPPADRARRTAPRREQGVLRGSPQARAAIPAPGHSHVRRPRPHRRRGHLVDRRDRLRTHRTVRRPPPPRPPRRRDLPPPAPRRHGARHRPRPDRHPAPLRPAHRRRARGDAGGRRLPPPRREEGTPSARPGPRNRPRTPDARVDQRAHRLPPGRVRRGEHARGRAGPGGHRRRADPAPRPGRPQGHPHHGIRRRGEHHPHAGTAGRVRTHRGPVQRRGTGSSTAWRASAPGSGGSS